MVALDPCLIHSPLGPSDPIQVHNPNDISISLAGFCTANCSVVGDVGACPSPSKFPFPLGDLNSHLTHDFLSLADSASQTASRLG